MAHYAKVENIVVSITKNNDVLSQETQENVVTEVVVAEQDWIDQQEGRWIQTSYNTREGVHLSGGTPLRKNYAAVGYTYDESRDAFIPPKPYDSWVLNEDTCTWFPPIDMPDDEKQYRWVEETKQWVETTGV